MVKEERRRLGAYHHHMVKTSLAAAETMPKGSTWMERGKHALLQDVHLEWTKRECTLLDQLGTGVGVTTSVET